MKRSIILLALLVSTIIFALPLIAGDTKEGAGFDPKRDPSADLKAAVALASQTHQRIILDVGGEWCIWCRRLDSLFRMDTTLATYLHEQYIVVKVNYSRENENAKFLSGYPKIEGYPHLFVLDSDGKLIHSQNTGDLESGKHHDPAKVMAFLKKWSPPPPPPVKGKE
jgi:thioredoxin-related protein